MTSSRPVRARWFMHDMAPNRIRPLMMKTERSAGSGELRVIVPARLVGLATKRNRIRRRIREALRTEGIVPERGQRITVSVRGIPLPAPAALRELIVALGRESGIVNR